jgi:hypothetical protein
LEEREREREAEKQREGDREREGERESVAFLTAINNIAMGEYVLVMSIDNVWWQWLCGGSPCKCHWRRNSVKTFAIQFLISRCLVRLYLSINLSRLYDITTQVYYI